MLDLVTLPSDFGHGANDGAYYPVGLLTLGTHMRSRFPGTSVRVVDTHHEQDYTPHAQLVGISASSTLSYRNVLDIAARAKGAGAQVVVGGPHASRVAQQILTHRRGVVDYVIRGAGEVAMEALLLALQSKASLESVAGLSWVDAKGSIRHTPESRAPWSYDRFVPLDFSLLAGGLKPYWAEYRARIDSSVDASFVVFTHFGCGYRERKESKRRRQQALSTSCSYCSLGGQVTARSGRAIVDEVCGLLSSQQVPEGAKVALKCYGDNAGWQRDMLQELADAISDCPHWQRYRIEWTFYMQSSRLTAPVAELLSRIGTRNLFIGFDAVDDHVQRLNGLGTNLWAHRRAVEICQRHNFKIHAGFVLGCAGETEASLAKTTAFARELAASCVLGRVNAAVFVVMPGAPAYDLLCEREPWVRELDLLDTEDIRAHWLRHFCPNLGGNEADAARILQEAADELDDLSPGPHASMGFVSRRMQGAMPDRVMEH